MPGLPQEDSIRSVLFKINEVGLLTRTLKFVVIFPVQLIGVDSFLALGVQLTESVPVPLALIEYTPPEAV
jgi:hypothetical protein